MAQVAATAQRAHVAGTVKTRHRFVQQAADFLARQPQAVRATLQTAEPAHFLWFAEQEFIKQNAGKQAQD